MKRARTDRLFVVPLVVFVVLAIASLLASNSIKLGNAGEWTAAFAGFAAAATALYLARESDRRADRGDMLERDREVWRRAAALGVELWVEVDRSASGQRMNDLDQKRYQVAINLLITTADHSSDQDLDDYCEFLCRAVWQPLVAVSSGFSSPGEPSVEELERGLSSRQEYLNAINACAGLKSFDITASLASLSIKETLESSHVGLNWDC